MPVWIKVPQNTAQKNPWEKVWKSSMIMTKGITDVIKMYSYREILNQKTCFSTDSPQLYDTVYSVSTLRNNRQSGLLYKAHPCFVFRQDK